MVFYDSIGSLSENPLMNLTDLFVTSKELILFLLNIHRHWTRIVQTPLCADFKCFPYLIILLSHGIDGIGRLGSLDSFDA